MADYFCALCGANINSTVNGFRIKPEKCPECGAPQGDIIESETYEENKRINAQEDKNEENH